MIVPFAAVLAVNSRNLIADGDFDREPVRFATDYKPAVRLTSGTYAIGKNPILFHRGATSMTAPLSDRGNMMVLNGSEVPGATCWRQSVRVKRGKTYVFSLWAASWGRSVSGDPGTDPSPARLVVSVDGAQIRPEFALDRHNGVWTGLAATFTAAESKPVEIRVTDTNTNEYGNDFALGHFALIEARS